MDRKRINGINNCHKKHEDRINLTVPKGQREMIQNHAAEHRENANALGGAIREAMERDQRLDELEQLALKKAAKDGISIENAREEARIWDAITTLKTVIPDIMKYYLATKLHEPDANGVTRIQVPSSNSNAR